MMIINKIILFLITKLPKSFIKIFASRYVAGESQLDAIETAKKLNKKGYSVTLDILGEHTKTIQEARNITQEYIKLFNLIEDNNIDANISIKPTHIGLDISIEEFESNISILLNTASNTNNFLRIDMESSVITDQTINTTLNFQKNNKNLGTVVQAYLYRTIDDLDLLNKFNNLNLRLCKGIYKESEKIAIQSRNQINTNYLKIFEKIIHLKGFVGIATHDQALIEDIYKHINNNCIDNKQFEFQALYGVPMGGWLEKHLSNNYKTRIYIPFGPNWYDYSIRRLKENPNIVSYIFKNLFTN